ncbi:hypothetical protein P691DRAFT_680801, partial [Macrolepiota fuliginosa MF-IS2]
MLFDSLWNLINSWFPDAGILSHDQAKQWIKQVTGVVPVCTDMCPHSCFTFTRPFEKHEICPAPKCGASCWDQDAFTKGRKIPVLQSYTIPIGPSLQLLFASQSSAMAMKYWQEFLSSMPISDSKMYTNIFSGDWYQQCLESGTIGDDDILLMFSVDGTQLYEHKASDCWIYIWVILNLQPDQQYKKHYVIPGGFIPG